MSSELAQIGERLRAYRLGAGLSIEEVAARLHISRASAYRIEKDGVNRIETLERVGRLLGVSVASLLGVDIGYFASAVGYFERLRQIERDADSMFVAFGPVSYLLTSPAYDQALRKALINQVPEAAPDRKLRLDAINDLMVILDHRKAHYARRRPPLSNALSAADIERFARHGLVAEDNPVSTDNEPGRAVAAESRRTAAMELRQIAEMLLRPPLGVQIGIVFDTLPTTGFNIMHRGGDTVLSISPFRLGPLLNIRKGIAMITSTPDAVRHFGALSRELWEQAVTGEKAATFIMSQIEAASP